MPGDPLFCLTRRKPASNQWVVHSSSKSLRSSVNRSLPLISLSSLRGPFFNLRTVDSTDVYVSATRRFLFGPISDPQSLMNLQNRLRVPPFTSASLALTQCFILTGVTTGSSAPGFDDYYGFICRPPSHHRSRLRLAWGLRCRSYTDPGSTALHRVS